MHRADPIQRLQYYRPEPYVVPIYLAAVSDLSIKVRTLVWPSTSQLLEPVSIIDTLQVAIGWR